MEYEIWGLVCLVLGVTSEVCRTLTWSGILLGYAPHTQLTLGLEIMSLSAEFRLVMKIVDSVTISYSIHFILFNEYYTQFKILEAI